MLMQGGSTSNAKRLVHTVLGTVDTQRSVVLSGPTGSGKTYALRALSVALSKRDIAHCYIDALDRRASEALDDAPPRALLLLDDYVAAPPELLRAAERRLAAGAALVGSLTEASGADAPLSGIGGIGLDAPALQRSLDDARTVRLDPYSEDEIARLVHVHSGASIDAVTAEAIGRLSWGRPGWALDLMKLQAAGSLELVPRPRIGRLHIEHMRLASLKEAADLATRHLDAAGIAAAIVLAETGARSRSGVADLIGDEAAARLEKAGILLSVPGPGSLVGVPSLYAAALERLADSEQLARTRLAVADHLLAQEYYGIPLPDQEAIFCSRVLHQRSAAATDAAGTVPQSQHPQFFHRVIGDLVSFGEGAQARDILLRLGQNGPGLSALERARLTTVLRDAHTGLKAILTAEPPRTNSDLPSLDASHRFALLLLRARLTAESGIPHECDPDIGPDDEAWLDAQLVAHRWNDTEPLGADIPALLRIARGHRLPEVSLLAEQLITFEASFFGLRYRKFAGSRVEQRIAQLAVGANDSSRDALETATVARSMTRLFSAMFAAPDGGTTELTAMLPGQSRHRIWLTHLHASHTAVMCGAGARALQEWDQFAGRVPRFLPWRLHTVIEQSGRIPAQEVAPAPVTGQLSPLFQYCVGLLDETAADRLGAPLDEYARYSGIRIDAAEFEEAPDRPAIRRHLDAVRDQNPAALIRAGEELVSHGFWAPGLHAYREARRIYLRRRASGSVASTDERITALEAKISAAVPWFDACTPSTGQRERLTPRETAAAKLAATGLSNRAIAEEMRCSVRTVESHIAQARAKLGLATRDQLKDRFADETSGPSGR